MTLMDSLATARETLARAGISNPVVNAEEMLEDLLSLSRAELYLCRNQVLAEPQQAQLEKWAGERSTGKPLQYILGHAGFFGLDLQVEEGVFIPRPETERVVEAVLGVIVKGKQGNQDSKIQPLRFLDIGTGCGAIAVALAVNFPGSCGVATDGSEAALRVAVKNAVRHRVANRIRFEQCDLFPVEGERFDLVVSNPPYIPTAAIPELPVEVKDFEPKEALDGGEEGLRFYRKIARRAKGYLRLSGLLALEIGQDQARPVAVLVQEEGYKSIKVEKDYAGVPRVVLGRRA